MSALEVVPLLFSGYQAMKDLKISRPTEWARKYRWLIYFFITVGFWKLVGAGLFGFMINPPIALFYSQTRLEFAAYRPRGSRARRIRPMRSRLVVG